MAKRFTDTDKWKKNSFGELSLKMKLVQLYLWDQCDHAGIWEINMKLLNFQTEANITLDELINAFGKKIEIIDDSLFMPGFIEFQYGVSWKNLNLSNKVHASVIEIVNKFYTKNKPLGSPLNSPLRGAKDKEQDQDKDKDQDKEKESSAEKITPDGVIVLYNAICAGQGKIERYRGAFLGGTNQTDFLNRANSPGFCDVEIWKELFQRTIASEYLRGESKKHNFVVTLPWLLKPENFDSVLSGGYPPRVGAKKPADEPPDGVDYDTWYREKCRLERISEEKHDE